MENIPSTHVLTNSHKNIQMKFLFSFRNIFVILMTEEILVEKAVDIEGADDEYTETTQQI